MSRNEITMDSLRSRGPSEAYDEGFDRIFRNKQTPEQSNEHTQTSPDCSDTEQLDASL